MERSLWETPVVGSVTHMSFPPLHHVYGYSGKHFPNFLAAMFLSMNLIPWVACTHTDLEAKQMMGVLFPWLWLLEVGTVFSGGFSSHCSLAKFQKVATVSCSDCLILRFYFLFSKISRVFSGISSNSNIYGPSPKCSLRLQFSKLLFFLPSGSGGWTQGLMLATQALYHLSYSASPLCVGYFWDRVSLYAWASLDHNSSVCASLCSWDDRRVPLHPVIGWNGISRTFFLC
jgi:hypothetical protein